MIIFDEALRPTANVLELAIKKINNY